MTTEDATAKEARLDLWWKSPYLTVDEAMNLILGFEPGTYRFDYEKECNMPDGSVPIYRALTDRIGKFELCLQFNGIKVTGEAELNELNKLLYPGYISYDEYLYACWWHKGNILTDDLRKWLQDDDILSKFAGVDQAHLKNAKQEINAESTEQVPVQGAATEEKQIKADDEANTAYTDPHPPDECVPVPKSMGSRKDIERIKATRQAGKEVREKLNQEKQAFDDDRDNWEPELLLGTGRIKKEGFMDAVKKRLEVITRHKLHRDAAVEEWKAVPTDLKHRGRVPED